MRDPKARIAVLVLVAAVIFVAGATAGSQAQSAGPAFKQVGKWGKNGTGNGQFRVPFGIASDKSGAIYVADTDNNRVQVFSASGGFLRKWGSIGSGDGQFLSAQDVAVDPQGGVWVADYRNNRVQRFSAGGGFQQSIASTQPTGVGVDADGNLYVQELSGRVTRYEKASDYAAGTSWKAGARGGDLEVSPNGNVYAADLTGLRVAAFDSAGKAQGSMRGGLSAPIGIGVDLDCNVWIGQIAARRVAKFSAKGKLLTTVSTTDVVPEDIAVGPKGDLYVLGQTEVLRFAEDKSKPATANIPGAITVSGGVAKIAYTLSGVACPSEVGATATLTGAGISGKAAGLKLKAGVKNTITMKLAKAASGKATFKIVLKTNGRPTTETKSVTVSARLQACRRGRRHRERAAEGGPSCPPRRVRPEEVANVSMPGSNPRFRIALRMSVAMVLVVAGLAGATSAFGHESGARPIPGEFSGRFDGVGMASSFISFKVVPLDRTSPRVGVRGLSGMVPGICLKDGKTRVAGRDGAIGIQFNLWDKLRRQPRTEIPTDGTFVFKLEHPADVLNGTSYSVSIRGTFGRKTVAGRVQGTAMDSFSGKCRADRTFTARLVRG